MDEDTYLKPLLDSCDIEFEDYSVSVKVALQDLTMRARKILVAVFGLTETVIAMLSLILACCIHLNFFSVRGALVELLRSIPMIAPILLVFGLISGANGLLLVGEWLELS